MRTEDFDALYKLEENYWWFAGMRQITDTIAAEELQKPGIRILDAGCGTGFNLGHYDRKGRQVYGFDIAEDAIEGVRRRGIDTIAQASVVEIPFKSDTFDLVFSFDVIEQIPLETVDSALCEMHRVLKPGGSLFVRVPAFEWLRSSHDEDLHTFHRFTRGELLEKLVQSGFKVEWTSYANTLLFPVALLRRFLKHAGIGAGSDVRPLPRGFQWVDSIFRELLVCESKWFKSGRRFPFGLSLICYAKKG